MNKINCAVFTAVLTLSSMFVNGQTGLKFSEVVIKNNNSIAAEVTLEAPAGTPLSPVTVGANSTKTITVDGINIQTAKISVKAEHDYTDKMMFDFSKSGTPYQVYIEKIEATTTIGAIHGVATVKF